MTTKPYLSGLVLIDKPKGSSSYFLVHNLRKVIFQRAVGHIGTLDEVATGLMGILVGGATKIEPYLMGLDKVYVAKAFLGLKTTTDDMTGTPTYRHPGPYPARRQIEKALAAMEGNVMQAPPSYSAIKVNGKIAYNEARAGRPMDLPPRPVKAYSLKLLSYDPPVAEFECHVSSGYYVRALARDLGMALNMGGGAAFDIKRLKIGSFDLSMAGPPPTSWEDFKERLINPREALKHLPEIVLGPEDIKILGHGGFVPFSASEAAPSFQEGLPEGPCKVIGPDGELFAMAQIPRPEDAGTNAPRWPFLRPLRVFGSWRGPDKNLINEED
ncbi:MAG: tRNA pseudouridine(55) synthase TruB [Deltaproteobacteria bacterium]|jgi:tRNA pseudouridine55 synthase|nr:tRNA pseudouridine(55) synthase TruB [Deltaproteobacteria bacterium]